MLDSIQILDDVLAIMDGDNPPLTTTDIYAAYFELRGISINEDEHFDEVLEKLEKDGYLKSEQFNDGAVTGYRITFDGRTFKACGGYYSKERENARKTFLRMLAEVAVVAGASMTAVYYFYLLIHGK